MNEMGKRGDDPTQDGFEERLTEALRRVDAPEGFAARAMRRCEEAASPTPSWPKKAARASRLPWVPARAWAAAALVLVAIGAMAAYQVQARRERARVARLQTQFDAAMQVTSRALDHTKAQLSRRGVFVEE